jgi:AraC-like DNA-binding protein
MSAPLITPFPLVSAAKLRSEVEQRTSFSLARCELNVYQTLKPAADFHLRFGGFTVTSMLRGRKVMHLDGYTPFNYVPGETVICGRDTLMRIDFPDARPDTPTQCTALVIDDAYLQQQLDYLNTSMQGGTFGPSLQIDPREVHLQNTVSIARISEKLIKVLSSGHPRKDTFADLALKELVLGIVQEQQLKALLSPRSDSAFTPFAALLQFVHSNLTTTDITVAQLCKVAGMSKSQLYREFTTAFGISPKQFILNERITHARLLLQQEGISVKEACYASGFSDPNYFVRAFKKVVGVTPGKLGRV